jgi:RimJ/RimL family protein N-acetyltransferase
MPPTLSTARLRLTPVEDHDLAPLHAHWNDPQVAHYLWGTSPVPTATVADIARSQQTFRSSGWGLWVLRPTPPAAPALIGALPTTRVHVGSTSYPCFTIPRPRYAPQRPL